MIDYTDGSLYYNATSVETPAKLYHEGSTFGIQKNAYFLVGGD